ncbi:hypothetical protein VPH35_128076 [Triticum aestivum]
MRERGSERWNSPPPPARSSLPRSLLSSHETLAAQLTPRSPSASSARAGVAIEGLPLGPGSHAPPLPRPARASRLGRRGSPGCCSRRSAPSRGRRPGGARRHAGKRLILGGERVPDLVPSAGISRVTKSPPGGLRRPVGGRVRLGDQVAVGEHKVPPLSTVAETRRTSRSGTSYK